MLIWDTHTHTNLVNCSAQSQGSSQLLASTPTLPLTWWNTIQAQASSFEWTAKEQGSEPTILAHGQKKALDEWGEGSHLLPCKDSISARFSPLLPPSNPKIKAAWIKECVYPGSRSVVFSCHAQSGVETWGLMKATYILLLIQQPLLQNHSWLPSISA